VHGVELFFLEDGGQTAASVAGKLVAFIDEARRSLDVAIYDFHATEGSGVSVADALVSAARKGVAVRVAFNVERPRAAAQPRPPLCRPDEIDGLDVPTRGIRGEGSLMHHKYVIRDGAAVWTGSANWTDDSFTREENLILLLESPGIAKAFTADFDELWDKQRVEASGGEGPTLAMGDGVVEPFFSPRGPSLAHLAAEWLARAHHRIRILSPVITSGAILGTLAEIAPRGAFDLAGAYDLTQMEEVQRQWHDVPANHWKLEAWKVIAPRLSGKRSTPYAEGSVHDYMHAKAIVADGAVLAGSYNLSRAGEDNAENVLLIRSGATAQRVAAFAERLAVRYRTLPGSGR
jgi:phosphatidylserine/phosphatidylglycerophosphate/cardiolipin synthase-like enzyme